MPTQIGPRSCKSAFALALAIGSIASADPRTTGEWGELLQWPNVAIHASLLPNGKVLFWGRREWADGQPVANPDPNESSLDVHTCVPRLWDPADNTIKETANRPAYNLFCSGHTFLADGRLFVAGGHLHDAEGVDRVSVYDYRTDHWTELPKMPADVATNGANTGGGRWYPTAVTLPDGSVLVAGGSIAANNAMNRRLLVWSDAPPQQWINRGVYNDIPYYPRMYVAPDGSVCMVGPLPQTKYLHDNGDWTAHVLNDDVNATQSSRKNGFREYGTSVLYDTDKVLFIGGRAPPTSAVEKLNLADHSKGWQDVDPMRFARAQVNATILPDGTVLVTGGTQGGDGPTNGFNDVRPGQPIHAAELWDPASGHWSVMAEEAEDRCYHSTALLLPDGRVLSAGGGEYRPPDRQDNLWEETKRTAQIYSPPYLFKGERPGIVDATGPILYGQPFGVTLANPVPIKRVTWVRLSSVTHSFNFNQRINFLTFTQNGSQLNVNAPPNANVCPPGHYMLFVFNEAGVPSVAKIVRIGH